MMSLLISPSNEKPPSDNMSWHFMMLWAKKYPCIISKSKWFDSCDTSNHLFLQSWPNSTHPILLFVSCSTMKCLKSIILFLFVERTDMQLLHHACNPSHTISALPKISYLHDKPVRIILQILRDKVESSTSKVWEWGGEWGKHLAHLACLRTRDINRQTTKATNNHNLFLNKKSGIFRSNWS